MSKLNEFINFCNEMKIDNEVIIGEFSLTDSIVTEDVSVGIFYVGKTLKKSKKSKNNISVKVFGKERNIPHFHVMNEDNSIDACFYLCKNSPFNHTEFHNKLPKEKTNFALALDYFMRTIRDDNQRYKGITNWEYAVVLWNENNPNFTTREYDIPSDIPDYAHMNWSEN